MFNLIGFKCILNKADAKRRKSTNKRMQNSCFDTCLASTLRRRQPEDSTTAVTAA
jgi:hypothetical protein